VLHRLPFLLALCLLPTAAFADTVSVAVAAHFAPTLQALAPAFRAATRHELHVTPGSTGKLRTQIVQGAPFAVFLAADATTPAQLEVTGHGVAGTRFTYALGRLALWSRQPELVDDRAQVLFALDGKKLALANPRLAPYGAAAEAVLRRLRRWEALQAQLVLGENVAQAFQFVQSGNAALGFVPLSFLAGGAQSGSQWLVPAALHPPLVHDAVLLNPGAAQPAARQFLAFLHSPGARTVIRQHGYDLPP
jgi:molybdate transport system substrate-binding protein